MRKLGLDIAAIEARSVPEIERAFAEKSKDRIDAVIVANDAFLNGQGKLIARLALDNRVGSVFSNQGDAAAGGLIGYGQSGAYVYRRAATFVDKILKGAKPGDLPFEQPTEFELAVNLKTAKALGITVPKEILVLATKVIE